MTPRRFVAPTVLVLLAGVLRFIAIGKQELWLDEALSWHAATANDLLATVLPNNTPPLYFILLRAWTSLFGDSRMALRSLSAVEGTAFVAAVIWWTRILFTRRAALWAGLWAAVAPMAIYYSQETRAYAQLTLLLTVTYGCISKALVSDRAGWWMAAVVAATATLYTHYLAILALVCCAALVAAQSSTSAWRRAGVAAAIVVLFATPLWITAWVARPAGPDGLEWIAEFWARTPPSMAIPLSLQVLTLGAHAGLLPAQFKQLGAIELPQSVHLLGLAGLALLAIVAAARVGETASAPNRWKWALALLVVGPLVLLWSLSWIRPLYLVGRYDQIALPACPVLLGFACAKLQARFGAALTGAIALLLLLPIGSNLWTYYGAPASDREARAASVLDQQARDGDTVVFTELRAMPVIYELSRRGYRYADEHCVNLARRRRFACLAYPRGEIGAERSTASATAADALDLAGSRGAQESSIWIVLGRYRVAQGKLAASPRSAALLDRLRELGLSAASADVLAGLLRYRSSLENPKD